MIFILFMYELYWVLFYFYKINNKIIIINVTLYSRKRLCPAVYYSFWSFESTYRKQNRLLFEQNVCRTIYSAIRHAKVNKKNKGNYTTKRKPFYIFCFVVWPETSERRRHIYRYATCQLHITRLFCTAFLDRNRFNIFYYFNILKP